MDTLSLSFSPQMYSSLRRILLAGFYDGLFLLALITLLLTSGRPVRAEANAPQTITRYVATTGDDTNNNCIAFASPCRSIQRAVEVATTSDEIRVAAGVYEAVVIGTRPITLTGGFTTNNWDNPNYAANLTVIEGTLGGNKTRSLTIRTNAANGTVVQGFTLRNGDATLATIAATLGGGAYVEDADDVQLRDLVVTNNVASASEVASGSGGGIAAVNTNRLQLVRVTVHSNKASAHPSVSGFGGGLYSSNGALLSMSQITVTENLAGEMWPSEGGGIYLNGGLNLEITQALIRKNRAGKVDDGQSSGGGLALFQLGTGLFELASIKRSIITENISARGGAVTARASSFDLNTTLVARNQAQKGGAIFYTGTGNGGVVALTSSTIADNNLGGAPEAVFATGTFSEAKKLQFFVNLTIVGGNPTGFSGDAALAPILSIFSVIQNSDVLTLTNAGFTVSGTAIPLTISYVDPANGDYHLPAASPAIDRTSFSLPPAVPDIDGNPREPKANCNAIGRCGSGKRLDYGAYEFQYSAPTVRYVSINGSDSFNNCMNPSRPCQSPAMANYITQGGDEIRVAQGLYDVGDDNCLRAIICIIEPITMTGGYTDGNWITPMNDPSLTILDGLNKYRGVEVVYDVPTGSALLQNFTIQQGLARPQQGGGGMDIDEPTQNLTVRNVHFLNNAADNDGGGLRAFRVTNFLLQDSIFASNVVTDGRGGGVAMISNDPTLISYKLEWLKVFNNYAKRPNDQSANGGRGGGIFLEGNGTLTQSEIYSNSADFTGGGVSTGSNNSEPIVDRCIIRDNKAGVGGGFSIFLTGGATLQNSLLIRNVATSTVGLLSGQTNTPIQGGNAIHTPFIGIGNEPFHLINVTVADNVGAVPEAIKVEGNGSADPRPNQLVNVLISGSPVGIQSDGNGIASLDKVLIANDVTTATSGFNSGKLTGTPLSGAAGYVGGGDYHLTTASAARDAGNPVNGLTVDLEGTPRPLNTSFDIGAYEFVPAKVNQTITFQPIGDKLLTHSPIALSASASSSLPVTIVSQTPTVCTVNNASVTLLAAGTCTLIASQPGSIAFHPAPPVTQSFQVTLQPNPLNNRGFLPLVRK